MKTQMINRNEYRKAGVILRTHGKEGGLLVSWDSLENPFDNEDLRFIFIDLDGRFIPFMITAHEPGPGEREVLFLEDIQTPEEAAFYSGRAYYIHEKYLEGIYDPWISLEPGKLKVVDVKFGEVGLAMAIGGTPENPLLEAKNGDKEILIPLNGNFVINLDEKKAIITVDIPESLLNLN
jgi:16S rRNA processing protein RimM